MATFRIFLAALMADLAGKTGTPIFSTIRNVRRGGLLLLPGTAAVGGGPGLAAGCGQVAVLGIAKGQTRDVFRECRAIDGRREALPLAAVVRAVEERAALATHPNIGPNYGDSAEGRIAGKRHCLPVFAGVSRTLQVAVFGEHPARGRRQFLLALGPSRHVGSDHHARLGGGSWSGFGGESRTRSGGSIGGRTSWSGCRGAGAGRNLVRGFCQRPFRRDLVAGFRLARNRFSFLLRVLGLQARPDRNLCRSSSEIQAGFLRRSGRGFFVESCRRVTLLVGYGRLRSRSNSLSGGSRSATEKNRHAG